MSDDNLGTIETVDANPLLDTSTPAPTSEPTITPETVVTPPVANWPENWRELVTSDPKEQERLKRVADVTQIWKSFRNMETKLSSGGYKQALPQNATPEQITAYRKSNGIPETPEGYFTSLPEDVVIGEEDKTTLGMFAQALHEKNASPEVFNTVMQTAMKLIEANQEEAVNAQVALKEQSRHALYQTWGPADYKANINAIGNWLQGMPDNLRQRFEGAQLSDGNMLLNDAEFLMWAAQDIRQNNPGLTIMPGGNGDAIQNLEQQLADNRKMMANPSEWHSKANAERRANHTKLIEQYENIKRKRA
jgi:hypothetical protein